MKPTVSILTPTWNRAEYLSRVWVGLSSQTVRAFEWIVANDGSEDQTIETVHQLASVSDFPIVLINASVRVGKSRIDNEAIHHARGEFIIWCDSDDVLLPTAIETLLETWDSIPEQCRDEFAGVTALCEADGKSLGDKYPTGVKHADVTFNDLLYSMRSDLVIFTRAELLKNNPFREVDFLISESSVWNKIGERKTRFRPLVLERKSYGEKNCLSRSGMMRYNRGQAMAIALTQKYAVSRIGLKERLIRIMNYGRLATHGEIPFLEMVGLWRSEGGSVCLLLTFFPLSVMVAVKDRLQGKVEKTHLDFERAKTIVQFSCKEFTSPRQ